MSIHGNRTMHVFIETCLCASSNNSSLNSYHLLKLCLIVELPSNSHLLRRLSVVDRLIIIFLTFQFVLIYSKGTKKQPTGRYVDNLFLLQVIRKRLSSSSDLQRPHINFVLFSRAKRFLAGSTLFHTIVISLRV